jgi:hypothetical protein
MISSLESKCITLQNFNSVDIGSRTIGLKFLKIIADCIKKSKNLSCARGHAQYWK